MVRGRGLVAWAPSAPPMAFRAGLSCVPVPAVRCVQLVATGDMTVAWQAAEGLSYLGGYSHVLIQAGAVEELTMLLQVGD